MTPADFNSVDVRVDGSIERVRAAKLAADRERELQTGEHWGTDAELRWSDTVDKNVDWITRITFHVQDGHRDFASWCSHCRTRRLLAFVEITLIAASLGLLALLNWWPQ